MYKSIKTIIIIMTMMISSTLMARGYYDNGADDLLDKSERVSRLLERNADDLSSRDVDRIYDLLDDIQQVVRRADRPDPRPMPPRPRPNPTRPSPKKKLFIGSITKTRNQAVYRFNVGGKIHKNYSRIQIETDRSIGINSAIASKGSGWEDYTPISGVVGAGKHVFDLQVTPQINHVDLKLINGTGARVRVTLLP